MPPDCAVPLVCADIRKYTGALQSRRDREETIEVQQREVYFQGMVQGVGFRYTTQQVAIRFAVTGYVRNLADGRVLVLVEGTLGEIDRFLSALDSRMDHYIDSRQETIHPATGEYGNFGIRY